jgi:uncharacterized protein (TIGR02147 family)
MARKNIFEYDSYQGYLGDLFSEAGARSGMKSKAALAAGLHTTYLSQVLNGKAHLSLEHAEALSDFLDLSEDEVDFFMLLLLKARAGSHKLKRRFEKQIENAHKNRNVIKKRIPKSVIISDQDQAKFYSSTMYPAIHVLLSIPKYQKREALADALQISSKRLNPYIEDLLAMGVVIESNGLLKHGPSHIHLDRNSPLISKHHHGWRVHTLTRLDDAPEENVHYSALFSLSAKDAEKMKENILSQLSTNLDLVKESKEEVSYVFCMDYYPFLKKP